jgi:hypothetical protein
MASPLNVFRTITADLLDEPDTIYTAPVGNTGIVLMAQAANIIQNSSDIYFSHFRAATNTETSLLYGFTIPGNDSTSCITGKLIIEAGDSIRAYSSDPNSIQITLSILESLNA